MTSLDNDAVGRPTCCWRGVSRVTQQKNIPPVLVISHTKTIPEKKGPSHEIFFKFQNSPFFEMLKIFSFR